MLNSMGRLSHKDSLSKCSQAKKTNWHLLSYTIRQWFSSSTCCMLYDDRCFFIFKLSLRWKQWKWICRSSHQRWLNSMCDMLHSSWRSRMLNKQSAWFRTLKKSRKRGKMKSLRPWWSDWLLFYQTGVFSDEGKPISQVLWSLFLKNLCTPYEIDVF